MDFSSDDDTGDFEDCSPRPDALIYSLRAFGYSLPMAIADLIDNSITAQADNVWITYSWNGGTPWVKITDDGYGMTEAQLHEAMRLGSRSPIEQRDSEDLGRFGLGLKTASFSQCMLFSVCTRYSSEDISARYWDLDYVQRSSKWSLGILTRQEIINKFQEVSNLTHGTSVLWQNLDKMIDEASNEKEREKSFLEKFLEVKKYLEMVFHQYLSGRKRKVNIFVGTAKCEPWDPYLLRNEFTMELSTERYEDDRITVMPYVLPHVSKRSEFESEAGAGLKGWNSQQGFYVYRNGRMIVSGGYLDLDLKAEDHYKLARIKVNITNDMDHEWSIDVRKALAIPPDRLRGELLRVAKASRQKASEIYRARSGRPKTRRTEKKSEHGLVEKTGKRQNII